MQGKQFEEKNTERWAEYERTLEAVEKKGHTLDVSKVPTKEEKRSSPMLSKFYRDASALESSRDRSIPKERVDGSLP